MVRHGLARSLRQQLAAVARAVGIVSSGSSRLRIGRLPQSSWSRQLPWSVRSLQSRWPLALLLVVAWLVVCCCCGLWLSWSRAASATATAELLDWTDGSRALWKADARFNGSRLAWSSPPLRDYSLTVSPADPERDSLEKLVAWLVTGGALFPSVYVQHYEQQQQQHGLHTLRDEVAVAPSSTAPPLLSIPRRLMLTEDLARGSKLGRSLRHALGNTTSRTAIMAAFVLTEQERGEQSPWWSYLHSLPQSFAHLPLRYDAEQRGWLKGSMLLDELHDHEERLRAEWEAVVAAVPAFSFSLWQYETMRLLLATRLFSYDNGSGQHRVALVPLADCLNHNSAGRPNCRWRFDHAADAFVVTAAAHIPAHCQLLVTYGNKSNAELMMAYGTVMERNEHDRAVLRFDDRAEGDDASRYAVKASYADITSRVMLSALRRRALDELTRTLQRKVELQQRQVEAGLAHGLRSGHLLDMADETREDEGDVDEAERGMRVMLERRALRRVLHSVREAEAAFNSTLEDDEARLAAWDAADTGGVRWKCAVLLRGEKRVLQWWERFSLTALRILDDGVGAVSAWQATVDGAGMAAYISDTLIPAMATTDVVQQQQQPAVGQKPS